MSVPVTTIGGFLGAGKTTLINAMLRQAEGRRIAVLVNEFGELSIDDDLIEAEDDQVISIAGGCICCSFGSDLIGALTQMTAMEPAPDHIVIEASGVAIPSSIAASIGLLPGVVQNGVVVLADAETVQSMSRDKYMGDTVLRQLADADLVLMTKSDLVASYQAEGVASWLGQVSPKAKVIASFEGRISPDVLLGPRPGARLEVTPHGDGGFASWLIEPGKPVDVGALAKLLAEDPGVLRAKGVLDDSDGTRKLVQVVAARWSVTPVAEASSFGVVCIGPLGTTRLSDASLHASEGATGN